jgi:hypothetical protein
MVMMIVMVIMVMVKYLRLVWHGVGWTSFDICHNIHETSQATRAAVEAPCDAGKV